MQDTAIKEDVTASLAALQKRLDRLEASEAIRQGQCRYARATDRNDLELLKNCYHPGAKDVHWSWIGDANEFADWVLPELSKMRAVRHNIGIPAIEFDPENDRRAFVESYWTTIAVVDVPEEGEGAYAEHHAHGRYLDIWEERNGEWKIAHRHLTDDGGTTSLVKNQPHASLNPLRTQQPFPNDPVYRRFDLEKLELAPTRNPGMAQGLANRARASVG